MKLLVVGLFIAVLVVIAKAPGVLRGPLAAGFFVLCIIVAIWRRAQPAPAKWGPPAP